MNECVYCGATNPTPFNEEHIIPRNIGKFLFKDAELVITNKVCNGCNNELSKIELELVRSGPEAMFRKLAGIKGRKRKIKVNPFYPKNRNEDYPKIVGSRQNSDFEFRWEPSANTGLIGELNQLIFKDSISGKDIHIPLTPEMSKQNLLGEIKSKGGTLKGEFFVSYNPQDKEWVENIFEDDWGRIRPEDTSSFPQYEKISVEGIFKVTDKHPRTIAKIAFNYLMYFEPAGVTGREETFEPVRNFIFNGGIAPNTFVTYTNEHILNYQNSTLKDFGHIVTCEVTNDFVSAKVHLFTGGDLNAHGAYFVRLGKYPFKFRIQEYVGHWFRITSKPSDSSDKGDVVPLTPCRFIKLTD